MLLHPPQYSILARIWALNAVFADANILSGEGMQQSPDTFVCPELTPGMTSLSYLWFS